MIENSGPERRRYERYPIYCPLEYKSEDEQPKESSITLNVSEGGALLSTRRELPLSTNIIMKFKMRDELFFLIGKVKHSRQDQTSDAYEVGVEFWDKPKTFAKKFYEELAEIMNFRRKCADEQGSEISLAEASLNWYKNSSDLL